MRNYTRNSDLKFYERNRHDTNCGSFALRVNEWYEADGSFEELEGIRLEEWIRRGIFEYDLTDYEVSNQLAAIFTKQIFRDFDDIRIVKDFSEVENNEELIAFRTFSWWDGYYDTVDWDFHFMVFRNGEWQEKMGYGPVQSSEDTDEGWGDYISDTIYFAKKI